MPKINPTSILPYVKPDVVADKNVRAIATSTALSTDKAPNNESYRDAIAVLSVASAHAQFLHTNLSGHLGTVLSSWRKRKN